jgi:hypothetical protein
MPDAPDESPAGDEGWFLRPLEEDDPRLGPPARITEAPVDPQLPLLPTHEMDWPDFERLLLRVAHEVQGLRAVQMSATPVKRSSPSGGSGVK